MRLGKQHAQSRSLPPLDPPSSSVNFPECFMLSAHFAPRWPRSKLPYISTVIHNARNFTLLEIIYSKAAFMDWPQRDCENKPHFLFLLFYRRSIIPKGKLLGF